MFSIFRFFFFEKASCTSLFRLHFHIHSRPHYFTGLNRLSMFFVFVTASFVAAATLDDSLRCIVLDNSWPCYPPQHFFLPTSQGSEHPFLSDDLLPISTWLQLVVPSLGFGFLVVDHSLPDQSRETIPHKIHPGSRLSIQSYGYPSSYNTELPNDDGSSCKNFNNPGRYADWSIWEPVPSWLLSMNPPSPPFLQLKESRKFHL